MQWMSIRPERYPWRNSLGSWMMPLDRDAGGAITRIWEGLRGLPIGSGHYGCLLPGAWL